MAHIQNLEKEKKEIRKDSMRQKALNILMAKNPRANAM